MCEMEELFNILEKYTWYKGYYELVLNPYNQNFKTKEEWISIKIETEKMGRPMFEEIESDKEIEDFFNKMKDWENIYELTWYQTSSVGHYSFYGETIKDLLIDVKDVLKQKE